MISIKVESCHFPLKDIKHLLDTCFMTTPKICIRIPFYTFGVYVLQFEGMPRENQIQYHVPNDEKLFQGQSY